MKQMKIVLFIFVCLFFTMQGVDAKEEMYGNIKMRSLGVGSALNLPKQHVLLLNSDGEMRHFQRSIKGSVADVSANNGLAVYDISNMQVKQVDDNMFVNNEPIVTQAVVYYSWGGGSDPSHPGVPLGDAIPFVLLLAMGYVVLKYRK